MTEASSTFSRFTSWRRGPAIVGLVALALLHISAATHQFEHADEHDLAVCEACATYSQLEDAAVPVAPMEQILVPSDEAAVTLRVDAFDAPIASAYRSRAPPRS